MTFAIDTFQLHCKNEHKQVKWDKITGGYAYLTVFFLIYNEVHYLNEFRNLFLDKVYLKNEW